MHRFWVEVDTGGSIRFPYRSVTWFSPEAEGFWERKGEIGPMWYEGANSPDPITALIRASRARPCRRLDKARGRVLTKDEAASEQAIAEQMALRAMAWPSEPPFVQDARCFSLPSFADYPTINEKAWLLTAEFLALLANQIASRTVREVSELIRQMAPTAVRYGWNAVTNDTQFIRLVYRLREMVANAGLDESAALMASSWLASALDRGDDGGEQIEFVQNAVLLTGQAEAIVTEGDPVEACINQAGRMVSLLSRCTDAPKRENPVAAFLRGRR